MGAIEYDAVGEAAVTLQRKSSAECGYCRKQLDSRRPKL